MANPYLEGALAPIDDESHFTDLEIVGEIPRGLRGTYLRNGPNPAFPPRGTYHLWDGDGMIHAVSFDDDGVSYRNRWVATAGLNAERRHGRALYGGMLDTDPPSPEQVGDAGPRKNPANTSIIRHAGQYMALWEGGAPTILTEELETVGVDRFAGKLQGPMTAHPKIDPVSGELLFFGYSPIPPYLRYHVVDGAGKLTRSVDIDLPHPVMMHDFVVTREHVVFFDSPAVFDFESHARGSSIITWKPERGTRVGVMPRNGDGGAIRWIEIDSCYIFHFLNAWSEGEVVHVTGASAPWLVVDFENEEVPEGVDINTYLHEYTIDLAAGTCRSARIGDLAGEFCKVPDAVAGLENRYGYLASFSTGECDGANFDSLTKYDLQARTELTHEFGRDKIVGEPSFAPDLYGSAEDDGFIVTWLHEKDASASEIIVLDARDIQAKPLARVRMPRRVPVGFHGNWMTP